MRTAKLTTFISLLLLLTFIFSSGAIAVASPAGQNVTTQQNTKNKGATTSVKVKERTRLKACQAKQAAIRNRSNRLIQRVNLIIDRFDRITTRVEEYYNNKLVPKGVTLENYDQLLADIEAKKQAAKDAASVASDTAKGFSCDSADPKAQLGQFRTEATNVIRALKEYKKSVIDFLVAVRTKGKNIKSPGATSSATPSAN